MALLLTHMHGLRSNCSFFAALMLGAFLLLAGCLDSQTRITSPRTGDIFDACEEITFSGYAFSARAGLLPGSSLHWSSDRDGMLDNSSQFTLQSLSSGTHTITLTAVAKDGPPMIDSVEITVQERGAGQLFSGVAVDPYISGATFYEDRDNDGEQDAGEQESSATDDEGRFSFPGDVSPCSTIRMKDKGLHIGLPFPGELKARVASGQAVAEHVKFLVEIS